jgi:hypothetical protein
MKFTTLLKKVILENAQSKFDVLFDMYTKPTSNKKGEQVKPKLTKDEFFALVEADPTTRLNNVELQSASKDDFEKVKAGKYVPWLIKNYLSPKTESNPEDFGYSREVRQMKERFLEDLYKVTEDLIKFERFKSRITGEKDINKLTTDQLYDAVKEFSLEKTKASADEKKIAAKTYSHPGGEITFRGKEWTVVKISDSGPLGKEAACFYGGYGLLPVKGETRWCTSSPGLQWFERYINKGPLYVIIPNESKTGKFGEKSGLPAERYQFHFPDNQFMDADDRQQDLVALLNGPLKELKGYFKPEFAKGLATTDKKKLYIDSFTQGAIGKFIALYGFDEIMESLPDTIENISIANRDNNNVSFKLPKSILKLKNLEGLFLENCVEEIPDFICNFKKLEYVAVVNTPGLKTLPDCIGNMSSLIFINLRGSTNVNVPQSVRDNAIEAGQGMWDFGGFGNEDEDDD